MALSDYYDAARYAGASLALYSVANIAARRGCIRADGRVKRAMVYVSGVMFQRAFWAMVRGDRVDWGYEAIYLVCAYIIFVIVSAFDACVEAVISRWEAAAPAVPVPQPAPRRGRGGRRPHV